MLQCVAVFCSMLQCASMGRLPLVACLKNICLSAEYRSHLALETYIFKQPTIRRHPICVYSRIFVSLHTHTYKYVLIHFRVCMDVMNRRVCCVVLRVYLYVHVFVCHVCVCSHTHV